MFGLLIPEMQLSEKCTLKELLYKMSFMLLDVLLKFILNLRVYFATQRQNNRLLFAYYFRMSPIVHCFY